MGWQTKSIMVCDGIFWSGQFRTNPWVILTHNYCSLFPRPCTCSLPCSSQFSSEAQQQTPNLGNELKLAWNWGEFWRIFAHKKIPPHEPRLQVAIGFSSENTKNGTLNSDIKKNYELLNRRQGYPKLTTQRHPHSVLSFCLHPTSHSPSALGST